MRLALALVTSLGLACGDTGQERLFYPIVATGVAPAPFQVGAWEVTLETAELAFGPAYFCASKLAAPELCPVAQAELADVAVINLLDPSAQPLGEVEGVTGTINSLLFDYGITWFLTQDTPRVHPAAPGGHSARFTGSATQGATSFRFVADLDLAPSLRGGFAVQVNALDPVEIVSSEVELRVAFDPIAWWSQVDFDVLAAQAQDPLSPVVIAPGTVEHNALVVAMTATRVPQFSWSGAGLVPAP